jgi:hypothetical protein
MAPPGQQPAIDEDDLEEQAEWAGWQAGQRAFQPGLPLRLLALRVKERADTFVRRQWPDCGPQLFALLRQAYTESFMRAALDVAWRWAWEQDDEAFAEDVRAYFLDHHW